MIAPCDRCGRDMSEHVSCTYFDDDMAVPYGEEVDFLPLEADCSDCGTPPGGWHHTSCLRARCPLGHQAVMCSPGDHDPWSAAA